MPLRHVFTGSRKVASSDGTSSGTVQSPSSSTIHGMTRTYSAKPPPAGSPVPAVTPTCLYREHCA